jgi:hypothetical protein
MLRAVCLVMLLGAPRLAPAQSISAQELFENPELMTDGTNVRLDQAVVRAKAGTMLRVKIDHHEIFVSPIDPSQLEFIKVGARVTIQGTLRPTPTAPQGRLTYAMGPSEAHRLARTRFYVDAWSVSVLD